MSQEIFQIMQKLNAEQAKTQLALQCAPLLMSIKISNLLIINVELKKDLMSIISGTGITAYELFEQDGKVYYLLYFLEELEAYLNLTEIRNILFQEGYQEFDAKALLDQFRIRYQRYTEGKEDFPHEMGVFLGYPAEDVKGFIENEGKNFLYSGYWKVYDRLSEKLYLFQQFERAKEAVIGKISCGWDIRDIVHWKNKSELLKVAV